MDKILIIDDNIFEITVLSDILKHKHEIISAQNGQDGYELAIKESPALILLDIVMKGMDGFDTLQLLKSNSSTMHIPVIFLTAVDNEEIEERGFLAGVVDYIRKPYNPNIVRARINTQINIYNYRCMIEEQLSIDGLTGIHNRRDFKTKSAQFWALAKAEQVPLSFMILDIDFFKKVNDTYGHMTGDTVLIRMAGLLKDTIHEDSSHYIARYGGEEFVVFLYNTDAEEGKKWAQKICDNMKALNIPNENSEVCPYVTLSIGGNTAIPTDSDQIENFIIQADQNLYSAKRNGRNQVVW